MIKMEQKLSDLTSLFQLGVSLNIAFSAYVYFFDYEAGRLSTVKSRAIRLFESTENQSVKLKFADAFLRINAIQLTHGDKSVFRSYGLTYIVLILSFIAFVGLVISSMAGDGTGPQIIVLLPVALCAAPIVLAIAIARTGSEIRTNLDKIDVFIEMARLEVSQ